MPSSTSPLGTTAALARSARGRVLPPTRLGSRDVKRVRSCRRDRARQQSDLGLCCSSPPRSVRDDGHVIALLLERRPASRSERGTEVAALFYSLIESAKL